MIFASKQPAMDEITEKETWFAIVNPNAGNGKGKKDWVRITDLLNKYGITFAARFTEKKGQAIEFAQELIADGYRKIISVGGDGTLNEIVNGIFLQSVCHANEVTLSMIPVGTGNDWGRMFNIPLVYDGSVKVISDGRTMLHDIGLVKYFNGTMEDKRYFLNIAGLGFESVVVRKTNYKKDRGKSNKAIYFWNLLSSLIAYRNTDAEITIDGKTYRARIFSLNVGNGRYCGGGMRQTPDALPDDGMLDITVIKEMGRIEIIRNLKLLYDGTILSHPKVDGFRSTNLKVSSGSVLYLEADGESLGHTPAEFSIIPQALNVVYGTRLIP